MLFVIKIIFPEEKKLFFYHKSQDNEKKLAQILLKKLIDNFSIHCHGLKKVYGS